MDSITLKAMTIKTSQMNKIVVNRMVNMTGYNTET